MSSAGPPWALPRPRASLLQPQPNPTLEAHSWPGLSVLAMRPCDCTVTQTFPHPKALGCSALLGSCFGFLAQ